MSVEKRWEILPNADLADSKNWRSLGDGKYATLRLRILIVRSNGDESRYGTIISAHNIGPGDTIVLRRRQERIVSRTDTINQAICYNATARLSDRLTSKVNLELSSKLPGFSGKLQSELISRKDYDISKGIEQTLKAATSYLIEEAEETEQTITLKGGRKHREAHLRRRLWRRNWEVYLHSFDYLELTYKRSWIWRRIRETIKQTQSGIIGVPLARLTFFEPQRELDVCYAKPASIIKTPDVIKVSALRTEMPPSKAPNEEPLEELARLAFPVTKAEKKIAGIRKKAAKRKVTKRKTARKRVTKKRVSKKRTARRKTSKKKAVKKKAAKRMRSRRR